MAEGWAHHLRGDDFQAFSAGIEKHGLNPRAVLAMKEVGVDITRQRSQLLSELDLDFDLVVTVCGHAHESCPNFNSRAKVVHVGFDDPPLLSKNARDDEEAMSHYRRVRDEIRAFVAALKFDS
jgi:arsenate reductase